MSGEPPKKHFPPSGESRETFEGNRFEDDTLLRVHSQLMREKEEPSENFSYPPLVLVFLFMLLSFWAGLYLIHYGGDFSPFVYNENASAMDGAAREVAPPDPIKVGKGVFVRNCVACHQTDGRGAPGVFPPVAESDWVQDNPQRLIKVILAGLQGPVAVNGNPYNNVMTPFGATLSDGEIAAVLTYMRVAEEFGNDSYAVSEETVAEVRAEYGGRSEGWTATELEQIHGPVTGNWTPPAPAESAEPVTDPAGAEAEAGAEAGV